MQGLKIGHFTQAAYGTGLSVFLFEKPAAGAYLIAGSGPASHELAPLEPEMSVPVVHALMLSGGSAYGLFAAKGVMQFLTEQGMGLPVPHGIVPIVPAACIYDLAYKKPEPPRAEDAYAACLAAKENNTESGRIGAGTGATVGKIIPQAKHMTAGIGRAEIVLPNGVAVLAYVVVNAVGDVRDQHNNILAGARMQTGEFGDCMQFLLSGKGEEILFPHANTTLAAIFTNAKFSKSELKRITKMAVAGMARAIAPVFTCYDGDILFSFSIGEKTASAMAVGNMAAEAVRLAIIDAVKETEIVN